MEKDKILTYLENNDVENKNVLISFLRSHSDKEIYSRTNLIGHITGSAFIVNEDNDKAMLVLHKKYNKWVAPGGHVEEGEDARHASFRETKEETGIEYLNPLSQEVFDIDIHRIPEREKNGIFEPEHWHFDVRYLYQTNEDGLVSIDKNEVNDYCWYDIKELKESNDVSTQRMASKLESFINNIPTFRRSLRNK